MEVIIVKNLLYVVVGLIAVGVAIYEFIAFTNQAKANASYMPLVIAGVCAVIALVCGALFMSGRVNQTEEIHITE
jgi:uncharacterized membrane protein YidH (DUF202 family)